MGFGLALVLHPLLGHQQDHRHSHQTAANDVEDRGAHAAGGGQGGAGVVDDDNSVLRFTTYSKCNASQLTTLSPLPF